MNISRVLLSLAAVVCLFASCKEVKRGFAPSTAGTSGLGNTGGSIGEGGDSANGGRGGTSTSGGSGGVGADAGAAGAGAGSGGEAGAGSSCTAEERRCRGEVPEACSADGTWEATSAGCAFGCMDGACKDCEDGVKACESGQAKTCVEGAWQFTVCDSQCEGGECVDVCTEGTAQCDGLAKVQVCTAGVFVDDSECPGLCSDGTCVGDCRPDATRCRPGSTTTPELCSSQGVWFAATCVGATPACLEGSCVACTPGSMRCSSAGLPQLCSEFGSWVDQSPCAGATPACVSGECQACEPSSRRCSGGLPQQCNPKGTAWVDGAACSGATPACVAATGVCGTCRAGDRQCGSQTTPQACDGSGRWVDEAKCGTATPVCLSGACAACQPGDRRCTGVTPQLCSNTGTWVNQTACAGTTPSCIAETGLCGCTAGSAGCLDSNTPQLCSTAGTWVPQSDCRGDTPACVGGACQCSEGAQECTSATTTRVCKKGVWEDVTCPATTPACVTSTGTCVECVPGTTRCSGDGTHIVEVCSEKSLWGATEKCVDFCYKGACQTPATDPGIIGCDAETPLMCKGTNCCFDPKGASTCEDPLLTRCPTRAITMECDGPSDCPKATPLCCATAAAVGCIATLAECTKATGVTVCDPSKPECPTRTTCLRAATNLFTCQ